MARILKVRGVAGVLVPHPTIVTNPPRFVGRERKHDAPVTATMLERYDISDWSIDDSPYIRHNVTAGHLIPLDAETARLCGVPLPASEVK